MHQCTSCSHHCTHAQGRYQAVQLPAACMGENGPCACLQEWLPCTRSELGMYWVMSLLPLLSFPVVPKRFRSTSEHASQCNSCVIVRTTYQLVSTHHCQRAACRWPRSTSCS